MLSRARRAQRPSGWTLAVGGLLLGALALRLWGIKQGLPYVYNVDEASNWVWVMFMSVMSAPKRLACGSGLAKSAVREWE